jgi:hypothetical protein
MPTVTCSACGQRLRVTEDVPGNWLTCPRCLASVLNPLRPGAPHREEFLSETAEVPVVRRLCPECRQPVESSWRFCPNCDFPLRARRRVLRDRPVDAEVKSDATVSIVVMSILGALVLFGIVIFVSSGGLDLAFFSGPSGGRFLLLAGVGIVVVLVGVGVLVRASKGPGTKALSGVLGGVAIALTLGLTFAVLLLCAIWSAFIGLIETCSQCGRPPH